MKINWLGTKEVTEMDRVMESIAQTEEDIRQKIFELGQKYYEENKDKKEIEAPYSKLVDQIIKLDQNRKGFYKNKLRLEGQMICENCGKIIPYGSVYCSECGKKADEKQESTGEADSGLKCKKCGTSLNPGSQFCVSCGAPVE